jgi:hypothetical protein
MPAIAAPSSALHGQPRLSEATLAELRPGALVPAYDRSRVETGIVHLGSSSLRYLHRLFDPASGREYARLSQFGVQLDLDARRPAPFAEELRTRAAQMLIAVG